MKKSDTHLPVFAVIIILGIIVIFSSIKNVYTVNEYRKEWDSFKANAVSAEATVTDKLESKGRYHYSVTIYVRFQDSEGNSVNGKIDRFCPGFEEGADVIIYYDKDQPKKIMVDPEIMYPKGTATEIPMFILGGALIVAGIVVHKYKG